MKRLKYRGAKPCLKKKAKKGKRKKKAKTKTKN